MELLVVAVAAVLSGADIFVEVETWAEQKFDWLQRYLPLSHGIPSHHTFGRSPRQIGAELVQITSVRPTLPALQGDTRE